MRTSNHNVVTFSVSQITRFGRQRWSKAKKKEKEKRKDFLINSIYRCSGLWTRACVCACFSAMRKKTITIEWKTNEINVHSQPKRNYGIECSAPMATYAIRCAKLCAKNIEPMINEMVTIQCDRFHRLTSAFPSKFHFEEDERDDDTNGVDPRVRAVPVEIYRIRRAHAFPQSSRIGRTNTAYVMPRHRHEFTLHTDGIIEYPKQIRKKNANK